jgi:threonine/homoserine/homoserine lactone efflux protein
MLSQAIGDILPAAIAVAISPIPIIAIVLMLGTPRARTTGPAFAVGWVAGLTVVSVVVVNLVAGASDPDSDTATGVNWMQAAIGLLFFVMAARQWRKRPRPGETAEMPAWMATVDHINARRALVLGVALSAVNPKNLALTLAASASIASAGTQGADTVIAVATFVAIGSITVAGAVLFYLIAPASAERPLGAIKQFMADNSATIMMVLLLLLGAKIFGDSLAGLWS